MRYPSKRLFLVLLVLTIVALAGNAQTQSPNTGDYIVNSSADLPDANLGDGECADTLGNCTLRAAIQEANQDAIQNFIYFDSAMTILLTEPLPTLLEDSITIFASREDSLNLGDIRIVSNAEVPVGNAFLINASHIVIKDLELSGFGAAAIATSANLGTISNIQILNNAIIDGQNNGIHFFSGRIDELRIADNFIGTTPNFDPESGNQGNGIYLESTDYTNTVIESNHIGNNDVGILTNSNISIRFNFIGTGDVTLPNIPINRGLGNEIGIKQSLNPPEGVLNVFQNIIAYNGIGIETNGFDASYISRNSFYCNTNPINALNMGQTISPPEIRFATSASAGGIASPLDTIEVFLEENCGEVPCQGWHFLGAARVGTDSVWRLDQFETEVPIPPGSRITATAINRTLNRTSDFSDCEVVGETYVVNTTDDTDDGICDAEHCSLREAIDTANANPEADLILFNIPGTQPFIIQPTSPLPQLADATVTEPTTIDATSQPGSKLGDIILDGSLLDAEFGDNADGLVIHADNGGQVYGLHIRNFASDGIYIHNDNIGLSTLGQIVIGANGKGNIITSCGTGINVGVVDTVAITIEGNYIGTDPNEADLGNQSHGIRMGGAIGCEILDNVIAYNQNTGVLLESDTILVGEGETPSVISTNQVVILRNSFFCNREGIVLDNANQNKAAPQITSASPTVIEGTAAPFDYVELYIDDSSDCTSSAGCQGRTRIGTVQADLDGSWSLRTPFPVAVELMNVISATATDSINTSAFSCQTVYNDECSNAFEIKLASEPCTEELIVSNNFFATPSDTTLVPNVPCDTFAIEGRDIWFKATVPYSGNLALRRRSNSTIESVIVETYSGECDSLQLLKCDFLDSTSSLVIVEGDALGLQPRQTVYFRVGATADNQGKIQLSGHVLPDNAREWNLLCDDGGGTYFGDQFVLQLVEGATAEVFDSVRNRVLELSDSTATMLDSCKECSPYPLQLWKVADIIEAESCSKAASEDKTQVDTVGYNYLIENPFCAGGGQVDRLDMNAYDPLCDSNPDSVEVAILDSGIDTTHNLLANVLWTGNGEAPCTDCCVTYEDTGYDFVNGTETNNMPIDEYGHGTAVNGVLLRRLPDAVCLQIRNFKVLEGERGNLFDAVCAMYHATKANVPILNLSWGFKADTVPVILQTAMEVAQERGALIVTSAGNNDELNDTIGKWPANLNMYFDNIITVGAYEENLLTQDIERAYYSSFGPERVDIMALGLVESLGLNNNLQVLAGTSMAAPLVTRVAALIKARYPDRTAAEIKDVILDSATVESSLQSYVAGGRRLHAYDAVCLAHQRFGENDCNLSDTD